MKNVLVLGATGFVGTHIALAFQNNDSIRLILGCRTKAKLLPILQDEETRTGDLRDAKYLDSLFEDIDVVINVASWTALFAKGTLSEELYFRPIIEVINRAKRSGVKQYINLSTLSAASSKEAVDANSSGTLRSFWPHLNSVIGIEEHLRSVSGKDFKVVNLRCGLFVGKYYALGILPILLPRLKTHLVPLVNRGETPMPLIAGEDIAQAFSKAVMNENELSDYEGFNILGSEVPRVKDVLNYLHEKHGYPYPHFSVPFSLAYLFARGMEWLDVLMPTDPLIVRSIVYLLEDTHTNNEKAEKLLGYTPKKAWKEAIDEQIDEMRVREIKAMRMKKEIA